MQKLLVLSLMLVMAAGTSSWAAMSGAESSGTGWYSSNTFQSNFNWSVSKNSDNTWTYDYRFQPKSVGRGAAFFSLEIGGIPTLAGTTTVAANANPNYLDPTLSSRGPMSARWTTNGSGSNQTWTTYNYSDLSYTFKYTTSYSLADPATLDKQQAIVSALGTVDTRPNPNFVSANGASTGRMQYDSGSIAGGNVSTTMQGLTWFLPSQEYGVPSDQVNGGGANGGGGREPGALRGYNAGWELTLTTAAAPMWGDFFLDGGDWKSDGYYLQGANAGYDGTASLFTYTDGLVQNNAKFIPTPDFRTVSAVPIPPSVLLFASGLGGLAVFRRKRTACQEKPA